MTNLEIIQQLKTSQFTDEDGESYTLDFLPGYSKDDLEQIKHRFSKQAIPEDLAEVLSLTRGWEGYGIETVSFDAIGEFGFTQLLPASVSLANDGLGNFWLLDLDQNGKPGKVWFACHDPAVLVIHSQSLNEFLQHVLAYHQAPSQGHLHEIQNDLVYAIWKDQSRMVALEAFLQANPDFQSHYESYEQDKWMVADLRVGTNKQGFAWGKYGMNQSIHRHPTELIWLIDRHQPEKKGFFSRLFG